MEPIQSTIIEHFSTIEDPRTNNKRHVLVEVITIALCAVICGANNWVEVEEYGQAKQTWLAKFLTLPSGIPSHDTFGRIFAMLDATQFQAAFLSWMQAIHQLTAGQIVPIDGKTVRHSYDKGLGQNAIHMVSAWASENGNKT